MSITEIQKIMSKALFLIDRASGRVVMLNRLGANTFSYTFLSDFRYIRLTRVIVEGIDPDEISAVNLYHAAAIIRIGVMTSLNCPEEKIDDEVARLLVQTGAHSLRVEA
ncbi:hypothetical protein vBAmaSR9Y3_53 [Alteromonas phage vB_AmaS-R9Y3]|nr:hypothetical protein vBAmaSR9Y3_53 [Alteromonas phage vB_AmaS-R9Y3]